MPCRLNKRREWTHRILLESLCHADNSFITLTYDEEHLPPDGSLSPAHLRDFLKRFRKHIQPLRIRFYAVGEYGDESQRPHYHAALFGYPGCLRGMSSYSKTRPHSCCSVCDAVRLCWGQGNILSGTLTPESAGYIAGYVTKKMTAKDDQRLNGRYPEFARMSNQNGGIGANALHEVASEILRFNLVDREGDVPSALRHGSRLLPLGRYLRRKLRKMVGMDEKAPEATLAKISEEMLAVSDRAIANAKAGKGPVSNKEVLMAQSANKAATIIAKSKIYKSVKTL